MSDSKIARQFDRQARLYEKQREHHAFKTWRKALISHAHGNVLELAVGAGANFAFYEDDVHVIAIDISPKMLEKAQEGALETGIPATFILGNAETITFPDKSFDTIVSTLSFCGYEGPLRMFEQINRWCKPGGTILLLEHGISSNSLIGQIQKWVDPMAKQLIGCHQSRDIMGLIENSPIDIVEQESHIQQTFHLVRARTGA